MRRPLATSYLRVISTHLPVRVVIAIDLVFGGIGFVLAFVVGWLMVAGIMIAFLPFLAVYLLQERQRLRSRPLPLPARDCVFVRGRSIRAIAAAVTTDRRFHPDCDSGALT